MFTGIVSEQGSVVSLELAADGESGLLVFEAPETGRDLTPGASIAVNGVCLTAVTLDGGRVGVDVMGETLRRTTTGELQPGAPVNLERCVPAGGRLDGHVVQGHVDGIGVLLEREDLGAWHRLRFGLPSKLGRYAAEKGSVAIDGVSLTVTAVSAPEETGQWFEVGLIPTTLKETGLGAKSIGDPVNLEMDVLAKYAERLLGFAAVDAQQHRGAGTEQ
ncbi:riboflavin synthase [Arthrobacter burdickii]|uniref:Riboflavin synthase n=1 Tax=Arthrobacter burdickii TaxID=3035920 RepID=A0ABT8K2X9_9MICC|nr:riboflavin synthase [Arthrobacter burdickii]MDN4611765.1 riboflavin synthase [Arthrobacter burdickii]